METIKIIGTESTIKKAVRKQYKIRGKIELLSHGCGEWTANGMTIKIWGNQYAGYTCNKEVASLNELFVF